MSVCGYQNKVIEDFARFRPAYSNVSYPPYHKGLYLEEFFYQQFINTDQTFDRVYIPVFWTACYLQNQANGVQKLLDSLDPKYKYFTVSQHDDAVIEKLPEDTKHFNAGGNKGGIPIPLVCSAIPNQETVKQKTILCSFVGSSTHPIRTKMVKELSSDSRFKIFEKPWSMSVDGNSLNAFLEITKHSAFSLCPRGYGTTSFRFYECLQLGSVPIFIYDTPWFPFDDVLDWSEFSILVHESKISEIPNILISNLCRLDKMIDRGKYVYDNYFSLASTCSHIFKRIQS